MKAPLTLSTEFQYVLDILEKTKKSVFVTGRAGTGKSTLLQLFRNTSRKKVVVLAPTGIAALNVGGQTIHSFFGFPPRIITPQEAGRKVMIKQQKRLYKSLEVLIVDEISMVRADVLDGMDRFLRVNRENNLPFGGVQVVFFGDLFQLPPVVTRDPVEQAMFTEAYSTPYFFSANVMQESGLEMEMIELRKVFRQESRHFLRLLEAVRENTLDRDDLDDLNERYDPNFLTTEGYITLTARNATADRINRLELEKLQSPGFIYNAEVKGTFENANFPTEAELSLRKGAQVMFVKNDNSGDRRFVNGSIGTVVNLDAENIAVELLDNGKKTLVDVPRESWEILRYKADDKGEIQAEAVGSFHQFPLKLAWAITIHKSQGKTFDRVVIDLDGGGAFEHGQLYVALSRCRTLEGIVLKKPVRPADVITDERIIDFYARAFRI